MPTRIEPPIEPTVGLTDIFNKILGDYWSPTGGLTQFHVAEAEEALQDEHKNDVEEMAVSLLKIDAEEYDGMRYTEYVDYSDFIDWLFENYRLEPK